MSQWCIYYAKDTPGGYLNKLLVLVQVCGALLRQIFMLMQHHVHPNMALRISANRSKSSCTYHCMDFNEVCAHAIIIARTFTYISGKRIHKPDVNVMAFIL